jgi:hypothetical protein
MLPPPYNIGKASTCYTERRKTKREGRDEAFIVALGGERIKEELISTTEKS